MCYIDVKLHVKFRQKRWIWAEVMTQNIPKNVPSATVLAWHLKSFIIFKRFLKKNMFQYIIKTWCMSNIIEDIRVSDMTYMCFVLFTSSNINIYDYTPKIIFTLKISNFDFVWTIFHTILWVEVLQVITNKV